MIETGTRATAAIRGLLPELDSMLIAAATAAARARAPYSGYHVGAAVLDERGEITAGCNVESGAYGATVCAERGAIAAAVAGGATGLRACVTVTRDADPASCCGICRQLLAEFGPDLIVVNGSASTDTLRWGRLADWLPFGFVLKGDSEPAGTAE
jgi:cytidine deaminase